MPATRRLNRQQLETLPVTVLRGVGPKLQLKLAGLGINSVADVLFHLPLRYQDRTRVTPIHQLKTGVDAVIEGEIQSVRVEFGRRRSLACIVRDESGFVTLRFFHFSVAQQRTLEQADRIRCYGEVRRGRNGPELYHPEYQVLKEDQHGAMDTCLTPIYPSTEGLHQASWRSLTEHALVLLDRGDLRELLPSQLPGARTPLASALRFLHRPPPDAPVEQVLAGEHPFQKRLATEELLAHHLALLRLRARRREHQAIPLPRPDALTQQFLASLPFTPTGAQQRVADEIFTDLAAALPMLRLVQGDVGSGKTLVAALAALASIGHGQQVALMAPTELLAEQHPRTFSEWLAPLDIDVAHLSGRTGAAKRKEILARLASGEIAIVVGTHALFQNDVIFKSLALVIIDEQHRFGVHQRLSLSEKGQSHQRTPHQLIMTATPIPRTLAMTAYADLDYSVIDELPPGRSPVNTSVIGSGRRQQVIDGVARACSEGRQVYWVCTLIDESDVLQAQAAEAVTAELRAQLSEFNIDMVHGRVNPRERADIMQRFKDGTIQLLVATTVIEVGVDVPNASLMVIENAERLGLAQLHQLRGRVGRGKIASHCILMYQPPLSLMGRERLEAMRETHDGFVLAERDLALRGPGEVLGTRQTGTLNLRFADLDRDRELLQEVRDIADIVFREHPDCVEPLLDRWMPDRERYARA